MNKYLPVIIVFSILISSCSDTDEEKTDSAGKASEERPIFEAVDGNIDDIQNFISTGPGIDWTDKDGNTLLHEASRRGKLDMVRFLVEKGADINSKNNSGDTPIHLAAAFGNLDIIKFLIEKGVNPAVRNGIGQTVLHKSAINWHFYGTDMTRQYTESAKLLLENDVNPDTADDSGRTPLHMAVEMGNREFVELLLERGASPVIPDKDGNRPLDIALLSDYPYLALILIENGAKTDNKPRNIAEASMFADTDKVSEFLTENSDVDIRDKFGWTALMYAAENGDVELARLLVENKADVNLINDYTSALHAAAVKGNIDIVQYLLDNDAEVDLKNKNGYTPLYLAVEWNQTDVVRMLISRGADVNAVEETYGKTPLDEADSEEMKKLLKSHGAKESGNKFQ